jgi:hypothetical protein
MGRQSPTDVLLELRHFVKNLLYRLLFPGPSVCYVRKHVSEESRLGEQARESHRWTRTGLRCKLRRLPDRGHRAVLDLLPSAHGGEASRSSRTTPGHI